MTYSYRSQQRIADANDCDPNFKYRCILMEQVATLSSHAGKTRTYEKTGWNGNINLGVNTHELVDGAGSLLEHFVSDGYRLVDVRHHRWRKTENQIERVHAADSSCSTLAGKT